jgi:hypothetical protein
MISNKLMHCLYNMFKHTNFNDCLKLSYENNHNTLYKATHILFTIMFIFESEQTVE